MEKRYIVPKRGDIVDTIKFEDWFLCEEFNCSFLQIEQSVLGGGSVFNDEIKIEWEFNGILSNSTGNDGK